MIDRKEQRILEFVKKHKEISSKEIFDGINQTISSATVKRILSRLINENLLAKQSILIKYQ
jgi:predicted transcriptional regulator